MATPPGVTGEADLLVSSRASYSFVGWTCAKQRPPVNRRSSTVSGGISCLNLIEVLKTQCNAMGLCFEARSDRPLFLFFFFLKFSIELPTQINAMGVCASRHAPIGQVFFLIIRKEVLVTRFEWRTSSSFLKAAGLQKGI